MSASLILVMLTVSNAGDTSAAFVNGLEASACKAQGQMVRSILETQKVEILQLGCFEGTARFEKFSHETPPEAPRYPYRVTLSEGKVIVEPLDDITQCKSVQASGSTPEQYCAISTQGMQDVPENDQK